jgi:hypothetical protein
MNEAAGKEMTVADYFQQQYNIRWEQHSVMCSNARTHNTVNDVKWRNRTWGGCLAIVRGALSGCC